MYSAYQSVEAKRLNLNAGTRGNLIGYILTSKHYDPGREIVTKLEEGSSRFGCKLESTEWDVGISSNPFRVGLWRALRRLVCRQCEPRRMPYSMLNFEDFLHQAMSPCACRYGVGLDGIIVSKIDQITNDMNKGGQLVLKLAEAGKHVIAEDGICLSCCHPATKLMLSRAT